MLELAGYYDGANVQLLEGGNIKKYQRVKVIVTDDFIDEYKATYLEEIDEKYIKKECTRRACETLLSFQKPGIGSGDYKKDLMEMLEKKYENADIPCLIPDEVYAMFSSEQDEQR